MDATSSGDEGVVVFLIGAGSTGLPAVRSWLPVVTRHAADAGGARSASPALGLLGVTSCVHGRGALAVQYWRDLESLLAYAQAREHEHRPAWREFNRSAREARGAPWGSGTRPSSCRRARTSRCTSTCRRRACRVSSEAGRSGRTPTAPATGSRRDPRM